MSINKCDVSLKGGMNLIRTSYSDNDYNYEPPPPPNNTESIIIIKKCLESLKSFRKLINDDDKRKLIISLQNELYILHIKLRFELGSQYKIIYGGPYFNSIAVYSVIIKFIHIIMSSSQYHSSTVYEDIPEIKVITDNLDGKYIKFKYNIINAIKYIIKEYNEYDDIKDKQTHTDSTIITYFEKSLEYCRNIYIIRNSATIENINIMHKYEEDIIYRDITTVYNQSCQYDISTRYDELIKYYNKMNVNIEALLIQYIIKLYILYNLKECYNLFIHRDKTTDDKLKEDYNQKILDIEKKYNNVEDIHSVYKDIQTMGKDNNFIKYCMYIIGIIKTKTSTSAVISAPYKHLKYKTKYLEAF